MKVGSRSGGENPLYVGTAGNPRVGGLRYPRLFPFLSPNGWRGESCKSVDCSAQPTLFPVTCSRSRLSVRGFELLADGHLGVGPELTCRMSQRDIWPPMRAVGAPDMLARAFYPVQSK